MSDHSYNKRVTPQAESLLWLRYLCSAPCFSQVPSLPYSKAILPMDRFQPSFEARWRSHTKYTPVSFTKAVAWVENTSTHSLLENSCSELRCLFSAWPPGKLSNTKLATAPHFFFTKWLTRDQGKMPPTAELSGMV